MNPTVTRPAWTTDLELEIFEKIINQHAPHLPKKRLHETKPPETTEEIENFYRFRVAGAAHDLFIVQVCANIIGQIPDPELQLFLSQQIGDDGAHAENTRRRAQVISGRDPIEDIQRQVQKHWDYMGDLPIRNWQGFLAFELHYEMHIVASLLVNSRTSKISDPESAKFSATRIQPEEAFHRVGVVKWWQRKYDQASPAEKADLVAQILELDEEGQNRRNPYLKEHWQLTHTAIGTDIDDLPKIYDAWRQEVLAYFLDTPVSRLPQLVSVND
ncbi:hypothetical protein H6G06_21005 [Anabaena sphaerica FACHB-251]|uniref:Uncharacterized protein n=1 Tax=Anabaena sphaerica FACHB-251 TaxID=2692883 RepID=A0A926WKY0_9NOST|nr:hypothetical protein [Anabaena sphaerica]MBD2295885.1 hypothetical protein [Anabaena sphaerica FACHB-251]